MQQITNTILMVRPRNIRANEETASSNYYQKTPVIDNLQELAQQEFDVFVKKLRDVGITVLVFEQNDNLDTPDAHFPNNWISFHQNGNVAIYPMYAKNRRTERREDILKLIEKHKFDIKDIIDYTSAEDDDVFLEGTGSIILDRINRNAYCSVSPRSHEELFIEFCEDFDYNPIVFSANQSINGIRKPIYHTNVMMCIAETFAIICLDSIDDKKARKNVINHLKSSKKQIITITETQVTKFAGNMLQLKGHDDQRYLVMSKSAYNALNKSQIEAIKTHCEIIYSDMHAIETCGGGSVRCLIAEVLLPQ